MSPVASFFAQIPQSGFCQFHFENERNAEKSPLRHSGERKRQNFIFEVLSHIFYKIIFSNPSPFKAKTSTWQSS